MSAVQIQHNCKNWIAHQTACENMKNRLTKKQQQKEAQLRTEWVAWKERRKNWNTWTLCAVHTMYDKSALGYIILKFNAFYLFVFVVRCVPDKNIVQEK